MSWLWQLLGVLLKGIADLFRGTLSDRAAEQAMRDAGRLEQENRQLGAEAQAERSRAEIDDEARRATDEELRAKLRGDR